MTDPKEPVNFRLGPRYKRALTRIATERDVAVSELIREVIEAYVTREERLAWEAEARRAAEVLAAEATDRASGEAEILRTLDANLEEFAKEWVWEDEE